MHTNILPTLLLRPVEAGGTRRFLAVAIQAENGLSPDARQAGTPMPLPGQACVVLAPHPGLDLERLATEYRLTPRQVDVAELLYHRRTNGEIADMLNISMNTTRRHVEAVLFRLGLHCRWEVEPAVDRWIVECAQAEARQRAEEAAAAEAAAAVEQEAAEAEELAVRVAGVAMHSPMRSGRMAVAEPAMTALSAPAAVEMNRAAAGTGTERGAPGKRRDSAARAPVRLGLPVRPATPVRPVAQIRPVLKLYSRAQRRARSPGAPPGLGGRLVRSSVAGGGLQ